MKLSDYTILFAALLFAFLLPGFIGQAITSQAASRQTEYSQYLTNACLSAAAQSDLSDGLAFNSERERSSAVFNFFETLTLNFNAKNTTLENSIPYYVPAVVLIDNDGFYISYNEYDGEAYSPVTTSLFPYQEEYGDCIVRFFLNGSLDIIDKSTGLTHHFSNCEEAYSIYPSLSFLESGELAKQEQLHVATQAVSTQAEYWINHHNTYNLMYKGAYTFTLPTITGEDWANAIEGPGILAFLQGPKLSYGKGYVNVYAFAGSRIVKSSTYVLSGEYPDAYYHKQDCPYAPSSPKRIYHTMEEAAASGAWPCQHCILKSQS